MIWTVEVLAVPATASVSRSHTSTLDDVHYIQWEDYVRPYSTRTRLLRQMVRVVLGIHTRRVRATSKVWLGEAAKALLRLLPKVLGRASHDIPSEHAKALRS